MSIVQKSPRILLLGDYSNCHRTLAEGLRALGCEVVVASNGTSWMQTERDIDITRKPGKIGGILHYLKMMNLLKGRLSGFDIVAINDPNFCNLKPSRLRSLFKILKARNKSVFYTAMSTDVAYLDMLEAADCPLKYSEWFVGREPSRWMNLKKQMWDEWHSEELRRYQNDVFNQIDGAVSVLYEYHLAILRRLGPDRSAYGGLPIDVSSYIPVEFPSKIQKVKIFLGRDRNRKEMKGSDLLEEAAKEVVRRHPDKAQLEIVENIPFAEFRERMKDSHVVLDQIYSYTPATTALMAMAYGLNVVSGAEPEYYAFIGEQDNKPIINAPIDLPALIAALEDIVLRPELIAGRGSRSREFVEKHNDKTIVAGRFLDFWLKKLEEKNNA